MHCRRPNKPKILVIAGPTSSGKTELAVHLAKKINGEIISADSRQVYKGLDIGTGKVTKKEMKGVPHHLINVVSPKMTFTVVQYKKLAEKKIAEIIKRGKVPIIAGGTGFYIQAVIDDLTLPSAVPNPSLRKKLEKKSTSHLFKKLQRLDPRRGKTIDSKNKRRLIRAIEIASALGKVPKLKKKVSPYEILYIGIATTEKQLKRKINIRLFAQIRAGMIAEAEGLHDKGLTFKRMDELGLEYRYLARFLQKKITKEEMIQKLTAEIWKYAKRQKTWFKRDRRIVWFELKQAKKIERTVVQFLK